MNAKSKILIVGTGIIFITTSVLPVDDRESHVAEELRGIEDIRGTVISGVTDTAVSRNLTKSDFVKYREIRRDRIS